MVTVVFVHGLHHTVTLLFQFNMIMIKFVSIILIYYLKVIHGKSETTCMKGEIEI